MKKKSSLIICLIIALILIGLISLKCFYLIYYNPKNLKNNDSEIKFTEPFVLKKDNEVKDYLEHDGIKIRNDFQNFEEKVENNTYFRILKDENGKTKAALFIGTDLTWMDYLKAEELTYFNIDSKKTSSEERINFLKENNITNDLDLFKFLSQQEKVKNNIFTPLKEIKGRYSLMLMKSVVMPSVQNITEIKGDLTGYIYNMKTSLEVNILKNNKRNIITFYNKDYFTDQYVKELLQTITID